MQGVQFSNWALFAFSGLFFEYRKDVFMPKKPAATLGIIYRMPLEDLHPHPLNPYGVRDDPAMQELVGSVKTNGVLIPAIARPRKEGGYELISGHRRKYACEQLGQDTMPVMVLNLKDDDAIIRMIDSNIQRENILPSERARAYKLKMEAMKRHGMRSDLTSPKISAKFRSDDSIGDQEGISGDTIRLSRTILKARSIFAWKTFCKCGKMARQTS